MKNVTLGFICIASFVVSGLFAADPSSEVPVPSLSPLNPDFVDYQKRLQSGDTPYTFGYIPAPTTLSPPGSPMPQPQPLNLPASFDLRSLDRLTPVKDQGSYGTCWAHAAMSSLESCIRSRTGEIFDFSENNLINLNGYDWDTWWGGNPSIATAYFTRWNGPVLEESDPYPNPGGSPTLPPVRHLMNAIFFPSRASATDNALIKQAIMDYGAVVANYYHDNSYYNGSTASYYYSGNSDANHGIALVGWDDNYPRSNFNHQPPANGAFIVKNNWGTWWGEEGYCYISYYDAQLAYKDVVVFYDAIPTHTYRKVYEYDPFGKLASVGYSATTMWGANIFVATGTDLIGAVGFYTEARNTAYMIYVYKGVTAGSPCTGTLVTQVSGTSPEAGYLTIMLPTSVSVANGTRFSVVIKLTTAGKSTVALELPYSGYCSAPTASAGQSYLSGNGTSWADLTSSYANANFCAKAYVFNETPVITDANVISVGGAPYFEIAYTGIKGKTTYVQHKASLTNAAWSNIKTSVPSYTGIQTNQVPASAATGVYRISVP